jgi:hypothetical protein
MSAARLAHELRDNILCQEQVPANGGCSFERVDAAVQTSNAAACHLIHCYKNKQMQYDCRVKHYASERKTHHGGGGAPFDCGEGLVAHAAGDGVLR